MKTLLSTSLLLAALLPLSAKETPNLLSPECATLETTVFPKEIICAWNKKAVQITDQESYRGEKSLELEYGPTKLTGIFVPVPGGPFKKGEKFAFSLYIKAEKKCTPRISMYPVSQAGTFKKLPWGKMTIRQIPGDQWVQLSVSDTLPSDAAGLYLCMNLYHYTGKVWIDEIKVQKGLQATSAPPGRSSPAKRLIPAFTVPISKTLKSLDDPGWKTVPVSKSYIPHTKTDKSEKSPTYLQVASDRDYLYFRIRAMSEDLTKAVCKSTWTTTDWNDERIEIFFSPGLGKNLKFGYITTNPDGIYHTSFGTRFTKNDIQVKRYADRFEAYFRVKKEWCGTNGATGHFWQMNAGRFHRIGKHYTSSLFPFKRHPMDGMRPFLFANGKTLPTARLLDVGNMDPAANEFGGNRLIFEFTEKVPADLYLLTGKGKKIEPRIEKNNFRVKFYYEMEDKNFSYRLFSGKTLLSHGNFSAELYKQISSDYIKPVKNPIYSPRPDKKQTVDRNMMTWDFMFHQKEFRCILRAAAPYSHDFIMKQLKDANISLLSHNNRDLLPKMNLKKIYNGKFWIPGDEPTPEQLEDLVSKKKLPPIAHYSYSIITGKNPDGTPGYSRDASGLRGFLIDPVNAEAYMEYSEKFAELCGKYTRIFFPADELIACELAFTNSSYNKPHNQKNSSAITQKLEKTVKEKYGKGKYGLYFNIRPADKNYPWCKLATVKAYNEELTQMLIKTRDRVKKHAPNMVFLSEDSYKPAEHMICNWKRYADCGTIQVGEGDRNVGNDYFPWQMYRTKLAKDLCRMDKMIVVPHAPVDGFPSGSLSASGRLESYNQLIRGGATGFHFWPASMGGGSSTPLQSYSIFISDPEAWHDMIEVTKMFNHLPDLKFPQTKDVGILYSEATEIVHEKSKRMEGAFNLFGVQNHGWPVFFSETLVERGEIKLNEFKKIVIAHAAVSSVQTLDAWEKFLDQGGTAIILDPLFAQYDHWGDSLKAKQEAVTGIRTGAAYQGNITFYGKTFSAPKGSFLLTSYPKNAQVIAKTADGKAMAVKVRKGKGTIIFTGFPATDYTLTNQSQYADAFAQLRKAEGIKGGYDIWRFSLPEIPQKHHVLSGNAICQTGNHAVWKKCFFYAAEKNNAEENYTVTRNGKVITRLTDRLDNFRTPDNFRKGPEADLRVENFAPGKHKITVKFANPVTADTIAIFGNGYVPEIQYSADGKRLGSTKPFTTGKMDLIKQDFRFKRGKYTTFQLEFTVPAGKNFLCAELEIWKKDKADIEPESLLHICRSVQ